MEEEVQNFPLKFDKNEHRFVEKYPKMNHQVEGDVTNFDDLEFKKYSRISS